MSEPRGYLVMAQRCSECLYGPDKIVSNERRAEILRDVRASDDYFVCHKATLAGRSVQCRGDYDARPDCRPARLARALGLEPTFIKEDDL